MPHSATPPSSSFDVFAAGHLGELTGIVPPEMVDAALEAAGGDQKRLRRLPSRVVVYLLLAGALKAELTLALANAVYLVLAAVGGLALQAGDGVGLLVAWATPSGALALLLGESLPLPPADVVAGAQPAMGPAPLAMLVLLGWLVAAVAATVRTFRWEP